MSQPALSLKTRLPRLATQIREDAVARARLTVVPRKRQKAPKVPFVALVSLLMLGGVIGLLLFNTSMQQASFAATALQSQADTLAAREESLRMEMDQLRDPQRLAVQARSMGMVPAVGAAFMDLRTGKVTGTVVPPTPVDNIRLNPLPERLPRILNPPAKVVVASGAARPGNNAPAGEDGSHAHQRSQTTSPKHARH